MPEESETPPLSEKSDSSQKETWLKRGLVFSGVVVLVILGWHFFGDQLNLEALARQESHLQREGKQHPFWLMVFAFLIYVAVVALSIPGASVLTVSIGWSFKIVYGAGWGFLLAVVLVSFASTAGASLAFLLSRYVLRDTIQEKFATYLKKFNQALEEEGAVYLFTLRLIPAVPFQVINLGMGLTRLPLRTYWWVTQLGMLPGTCIFVYAGWAVSSLQKLIDEGDSLSNILTPKILIALVLLGLFPLAVKKGMSWWSKSRESSRANSQTET